MKEVVMYAKYNQTGNKIIYDILSNMTHEEREKNRGSFFGGLSGVFRHIPGGTLYFLGMFKGALAGHPSAASALSGIGNITLPPEEKGELSDSEWRELGVTLAAIDAAYVAMAEALSEADMSLPVKTDWYGGNPAEVPLMFMLSQLVVHNTHHRGQISQILDSLSIANDYSGIQLEALPKY